ncbi:LA2681 family HEPN domain-containing protein [Bombella sp. TMW 2.2543]|uniref:LA2681 family HEPN domain-containing protein n=1 Tax=Bombella pluederhausensis TaxID=2967336 RepID=A0ABT3WE07_9PROT|nr:LA2681 family HEPN domain-containing protein [Bombella pluederhausensis]MCX5617304.1 LA2681 family HEPN domain-containing protein [Bombella pluederhausensis]
MFKRITKKEAERLIAKFYDIESRLQELLNRNPEEAIREAREIKLIDKDFVEYFNLNQVKACILVNAGSLIRDKNALEEGLRIFQWCYEQYPNPGIAYNLANGMSVMVGTPPHNADWLDHQERTRHDRNKIRQYFWKAADGKKFDNLQRSIALTNLGNQFSASFRYGDAQDAWSFALKADPKNGVAACCAARNLFHLYQLNMGSDATLEQIKRLSRIIRLNKGELTRYTSQKEADDILNFASKWDEPLAQPLFESSYVQWVKDERLALAPTLEAVNPTPETLDWLCLPGIKVPAGEEQPIIFSMFNMLKSDYILARDLTWQALDRDHWADIEGFASTFDGALYGADTSALILAHRSVLDILDKISVFINRYFEIGENMKDVNFRKLWRVPKIVGGGRPLKDKVTEIINSGVLALYGLVELSGDYNSDDGIFNTHKNIRNSSTHRFLILHEYLLPEEGGSFEEVKRFEFAQFQEEVLQALRIARSALQILVLSIKQNEDILSKDSEGLVLGIDVPDFRRS